MQTTAPARVTAHIERLPIARSTASRPGTREGLVGASSGAPRVSLSSPQYAGWPPQHQTAPSVSRAQVASPLGAAALDGARLHRLLVRAAFGFTGPRRPIPGRGFSGVIESAAPDVRELAVGDRVFGIAGLGGGAHAEYLTVSARGTILRLPESLTFEEGAAFFFGGLTAADFLLDKGQMQRGEHLAVIGATGSVGSAALSLAKHLGLHATAVASVENHALARELGASEVIDYRPLVGQTLPFADIVAAHRLAGGWHKRGNVVLRMVEPRA